MSNRLKLILYSLAAISLITIIVLVYRDFKASSQYQELQQREEANRKQWEEDREALEKKLIESNIKAAESKAMSDALIAAGEEKKGNIAKVIAEMKETEAEYAERKKQLEQEGKTLSPDDLEYELCLDLKRLGYRVTCTRSSAK